MQLPFRTELQRGCGPLQRASPRQGSQTQHLVVVHYPQQPIHRLHGDLKFYVGWESRLTVVCCGLTSALFLARCCALLQELERRAIPATLSDCGSEELLR